jgi:hypothetical protein
MLWGAVVGGSKKNFALASVFGARLLEVQRH